MATTPRGLPLADGATVFNPPQGPLNALANAVDAAIGDGLASITTGYYLGTAAERAALAAPDLRNGITWFETDTNIIWERKSGAWVARTPYAMAAGVATVDIMFPVIQFPAGRFTQPPIVTAQLISGSSTDNSIFARVTNITATQFQCRHNGTSGTRVVHWQAIQMTPTSAAG